MYENRRAFTLVELLLVCLIVGALAALAIPRYSGAKDKAYAAAMAADLHTAAFYEEQFASDNHGQYFAGKASRESPLNGFAPSKDVTVTLTTFNILDNNLPDWSGVARHAQTSDSCQIRAGVVTCTTSNPLTTGILNRE